MHSFVAELGNRSLTFVLGALLLLTRLAGLTGWTSRWRVRGAGVWMLGLLSGFFGGVAGNQGGLRSAALLSFRLEPVTFVATATATALLVDLGRTPIYLWRVGPALVVLWVPISVATSGVLLGTLLGERVLLGLQQPRFRLVVSVLILLVGLLLLGSAA